MNILGKRSNLPFSRKSDRKKEKSTVSFTHEQNIICIQTQLDSIAREQTIINTGPHTSKTASQALLGVLTLKNASF